MANGRVLTDLDMVDRNLIRRAITSIVQRVETLRTPRAQMLVLNGSALTPPMNYRSFGFASFRARPEWVRNVHIYTGKVIDVGLQANRIHNWCQGGLGIGFGYYETHQEKAYRNPLQSKTRCGAVAN